MKKFFLLLILSISAYPQTPPFSGLTLTAWWTLGYPGTLNPSAYNVAYPDLIGSNNLSMVLNMATGNSTSAYNVGANNAGGQTSSTSYAHYGTWSRTLTSTEHNALAAGDTCTGNPCSYTLTSLNTGLKCYWAFGEASGTSVHHTDTSGNSCPDLVDTASSVQVTGPNGVGDFATAYTGGGYATSAHNSKTDPGSGSYSYFIAVNMATLVSSTEAVFNCQLDLVAKTSGVCAYYQALGTNTFNTDHGNGVDLNHSGVLVNTSAGMITANTWYALGYSYNSAASFYGTENMYVNGFSNSATFDRSINLLSPFAFPGASACYSGTTTNAWDCGGVQPGVVAPVLQVTSPTSALGFSSSSRTWAFWVTAANVSSGTVQTISALYNSATNIVNLAAQIVSSTIYLISGNSTPGDFQYCNTAITNGSHLIVYYYDAGTNTQHAYLDNSAFSTCASVSHTPTLGTLPFLVGANTNTSSQTLLGQTVDNGTVVNRMLFANGIPTGGDLNLLWNGGSGYTYTPSSSFANQVGVFIVGP